MQGANNPVVISHEHFKLQILHSFLGHFIYYLGHFSDNRNNNLFPPSFYIYITFTYTAQSNCLPQVIELLNATELKPTTTKSFSKMLSTKFSLSLFNISFVTFDDHLLFNLGDIQGHPTS